MTGARAQDPRSLARLVALVCFAQVLVQIGAFFWPALLPGMMQRWSLSNSEAGWITAAFYGAYMLAVPVLVTLTDRVDPKRVYLFGVGCTILGHLLFGWLADGFWSALLLRALTGIGWAGTYMTGLKLLADRVDPRLMSRAVTGHAASIGISGAASFACADLLDGLFGWRVAFVMVAGTAALAWLLVAWRVPARESPKAPVKPADGGSLYDFRPVLANRSAMAYALAYCVHTLEMNAIRGWGVAFLGYVALAAGGAPPALAPTTVLTLLALAGTVASIAGNEASIRIGRRRLVTVAMAGSALVAGSIGWLGTGSYLVAVGLVFLWGMVAWLDSSSLTAGTAGTADPARRGATLAIHSMLGYAGGFVGPLMVGFILDLSGGMSTAGWTAAFASIAVLMLAALLVFSIIRPRELEGEGSARASPPAPPG
ncbi:MAG: MFS transporter [Burkholderiales bacterium]|nr:MFS transporter [Burkholderiales bacterium]